jgi:glycosyltransferase involved in cell wall biosynthesis
MTAAATPPRVSVISATYRSPATLGYALRSVLNQTMPAFEVWVVGDACSDESAAVVAGFNDPRLRWHNLPYNTGNQSGPNNAGLRLATADYVAYLGHDDLWLPDHLATLLAAIEEQRAAMVHAMTAVISPAGLEMVLGPPPLGLSYARYNPPPSSWLHHRSLTTVVGDWRDPQQLGQYMDSDLVRRAFFAEQRIVGCAQLSVLKFPSPLWRLYERRDHYPQPDYWAAIQRDPAAVRQSLLTEAAQLAARYQHRLFSVREALVEVARAIRFRSTEAYGIERWPLSWLRYLRFQQHRRRQRARSGIPIARHLASAITTASDAARSRAERRSARR